MYDFARARPALFASGDLNLTVLYNTSTYWDDLAWAAGWLYKATKQARGQRVLRGARTEGRQATGGGRRRQRCRPPTHLPPVPAHSRSPLQDSYLTDVYEFYVKHLADEGPIAGFK